MPPKITLLKCTVPDCPTLSQNGFSSLPSNLEIRKIWFEKLQLNPEIKKHRVCTRHFNESDYGKNRVKLQLLKDRVPSRNLPVRQSFGV